MFNLRFIISISTVAVMVCTVAANSAVSDSQHSRKTLSAPEAHEEIQNGGILLIDIRRMEEWKDTGVAAGAREITMHDPEGPRGFLDSVLKEVQGNRSRPIALICAAGVRSSWAQKYLQANGFSNVSNVIEGMLGRGPNPGWIRRGLPISECSTCY